MNYIIADFIIRIKNAVMAGRKRVILPYSRISENMGKVLTKENFLLSVKSDVVNGKKILVADIVYEKRVPRFTDAKIISKPSLRVYAKAKDSRLLHEKGLRKIIVSTNKGIMTGKEAVKKGLGGELLFEIW